MMDLTPLDIRKKKGDFTRGLRGYDQQQVDQFLDLMAERLEEVVKLNLSLRERVELLDERVQGQEDRERAVQEALVTAQSLKRDILDQAKREAELLLKEAQAEAERTNKEVKVAAERTNDEIRNVIQSRAQEMVDLARARARFLKGFRGLLERELDMVEVAESNPPSEELDLDFLRFGRAAPERTSSDGRPSDAEMSESVATETDEAESEGELEEAPAGAEPS